MEDLVYPSEDGEPMADDTWQSRAMMNAATELELAHPDALVAVAILVYPEKGNVDNRISPDVLVALGAGCHNRMSYKVWVEGKPPDWVLEVATPRSEADDRGYKWDYYAAMAFRSTGCSTRRATCTRRGRRGCKGSGWWTASTAR